MLNRMCHRFVAILLTIFSFGSSSTGIPTPHEAGTENIGIETYIDSFGRENIQISNVILIDFRIMTE